MKRRFGLPRLRSSLCPWSSVSPRTYSIRPAPVLKNRPAMRREQNKSKASSFGRVQRFASHQASNDVRSVQISNYTRTTFRASWTQSSCQSRTNFHELRNASCDTRFCSRGSNEQVAQVESYCGRGKILERKNRFGNDPKGGRSYGRKRQPFRQKANR